LEVTGGQLGSVTSAEKLTDVAEALLMQDAADLDRHLNDYVFPAMSRANFPQDSPRVIIETTGLEPDNRAALLELIKALVGQSPDVKYFDLREAMERLEFPLKTEEQVRKEEAEARKAQQEQAEQQAKLQAAQQRPGPGGQQGPSGKRPAEGPKAPKAADGASRTADVTDAGRVVVDGNPLPTWDDEAVPLDDGDAAIAVAWWRDFAPEGARGLLDALPEAGGLSAYDDNPAVDDSLGLGGPGSGNWGHAGRKGKVGGSQSRSDAMSVRTGKDWLDRYERVAGKAHPEAKEAEEERRKAEAERKAAEEAKKPKAAKERLDATDRDYGDKVKALQKRIDEITEERRQIALRDGPYPKDKRYTDLLNEMLGLIEEKKALNRKWTNETKKLRQEIGRAISKEAREAMLADPMISGRSADEEYIPETLSAYVRGKYLLVDTPSNLRARFNELVPIPAGVKKEVEAGCEVFRSMVSERGVITRTANFEMGRGIDGRAYCDGNTIQITNFARQRVVVHELGHWLEYANKGVRQRAKAFLARRTRGEKEVKLADATGSMGYRSNERAKVDKFLHPYMGKVYSDATEIVSMGLEEFFVNPIRLARKDPDYFDFIYAVVRGYDT